MTKVPFRLFNNIYNIIYKDCLLSIKVKHYPILTEPNSQTHPFTTVKVSNKKKYANDPAY